MKKLLVIMGAGASIDFGMPSVSDIDKFFDRWSTRYHRINKGGPLVGLYQWAKQEMVGYSKSVSKDGNPKTLNFEDILYGMQNISSDLGTSNAFFKKQKFPEIQNYLGLVHEANGRDFFSHGAFLTEHLLKELREKCNALKTTHIESLQTMATFFESLREDFDIGVINLNYDNVLLTALPDLSTGFHPQTGRFDMAKFYGTDWNFCYHLHGSVHFDMEGAHEIFWRQDLGEKFNVGSANRAQNMSQEGNAYRHSNIITGLDKVNQLFRDPFKQYLMKLDQLIFDADSILFVGYGFNDSHLNKMLETHFKAQTKIRKIAAIDFQDTSNPSLAEGGNDWGFRLKQTTYTPHYAMGNGDEQLRMPKTVDYYRSRKTFEYSNEKDSPLFVWYNGFMEACMEVDKFKDVLS